MNVEKTMEFILQSQARAEIRTEKAEARLEKVEARLEKSEARMDKFDKRLNSITKLVQTGMKMLVRIEKAQKEQGKRLELLTIKVDKLADTVEELADAQKVTEKKLQAYFDSLRNGKGKNGR